VSLREEILEQPAVAARLLATQHVSIARIRDDLAAFDPAFVLIAARGSSDHAAIYAQYLFGLTARLPVALAAPSLTSLYGVEPRVGRALVIGISQSGVSPDVVGVVEAAHAQGAFTIAISNDGRSPLARAAGRVIELGAGVERSIAATKTYTAQLLALAVLAGVEGTERIPEALAGALSAEPEAREAARAWSGMATCTVLGRGFGYATAREWALKLKELAYVVADPYSAADFQHGPLALIDPGDAVLLVAPSGAALAGLTELARRLRDDLDASLLVVSDDPEARALGAMALPSPAVPEPLSPIVSIVPAQLFALHLALAKGLDPERPRNLAKVTSTR
jgi:glucosamine--fructose-6-phosphate aminotransferase (isomerizing)